MSPHVIFVPAPVSGASLRFQVQATTSGTFTTNSAPTGTTTWIGPDVGQFVPYNSTPFRTNSAKSRLEFLFKVDTADWINSNAWNTHFLANSPRVEFSLSTGATYVCDPGVNPGDSFGNRAGTGDLVRLRAQAGSASSFWSEWQNASSGATITLKVYYIP